MNLRIFLRAICILGFAAAGFAYQAPSVAAKQTYAPYMLPDGTYAVMCSYGDGQDQPPSHPHPCELCVLAGSLLLNDPLVEVGAPDALDGYLRPVPHYDGPSEAKALARPRSRAPPRYI